MKNASLVYKLSFGFVLLWFVVGGIGHFTSTDFFAKIVPPYIPMEPRLVVQISGVFELLGAVGLLLPRSRVAAAWGLFVLTICVTPANIYMWQHHELFPKVSPSALLFRLFFQLVLLGCIYRCTRPVHALANLRN